ncbi:hypothetical protein AB205_0151900 [Aquarana catesbeiana]|uniref:Uncharacterized protein n=1 Tax=Aquarana catesbeiana TaxID=8400 RepID=A0A2G9RGI4_AQUCT|nr:hypothetical protein AB205_0151900 [Aquarana catesbeiana]
MFHIPISARKYLCAKYTFFLFTYGRKDSGHQRRPGTPHLWKKGKYHQHNRRRREMFLKIGEIVTTTGDGDVVEEECHFTSESAQILIREIMGCNCDLENIKENISNVQKKYEECH